jgi:hypothetical protein
MTSECKALSVSADVFPIYAMIEKQQLKSSGGKYYHAAILSSHVRLADNCRNHQ